MIPAPFEQAKNLSKKANKAAQINHGFFGRIGIGKSNDFNCSLIVGGQKEQAEINRNIAKNTIAGDDAILASLHQTHSCDVVTISSKIPTTLQNADALVTKNNGIALSILTADCCPILFADMSAGVIGAAHAGWQGAVGGIILNTINAMIVLGAKTENIVAAIGPTISGASYEIGSERAKDISKMNKNAENFIYLPDGSTREHFDLPNFIMSELKTAGIRNVEKTGTCTANNPQKYYSHRYSVNNDCNEGRQISIIALK